MNTNWVDSIQSTPEKPRRFSFINAQTSGLGAWLEFTTMGSNSHGSVLEFVCEAGKGWVVISEKQGSLRNPFEDRHWCFGVLERNGSSYMFRIRFIREHSSGLEDGFRVFTHWRHGDWKSFPQTDQNGSVVGNETALSFGWSPNGNGFYWQPKPDEPKDQNETKKAPKVFNPAGKQASSVESAPVPEKKPKMFVPKSKPTESS